MKTTCQLGIGANLGHRSRNIHTALRALTRFGTVSAVSRPYRTKPYGVTDQPDFINLAVTLITELSPADLLTALKQLEKEIGRTPTRHWGERLIDLDILFYGQLIYRDSTLQIPHPDLQNRLFVLQPLRDIAPGLVHPVLNLTVSQLYSALAGKNDRN